jgi:hypothetical protein
MDFGTWFEGLPAAQRTALAAEFADGLARDGLTVYRGAEDRFVPIAPSLSPEIIDDAELAALAADAHLLLSATAKVAIWTLGDDPDARRHAARLYHGFTELEHAALRRDPSRLRNVATARVDYFRGPGGTARALELNATIPAMQGYSDLIAHRWLRTMARARGLDDAAAEALVARAGSNTADLLASLTARFPGGGRPSILIVSRRGDSQLGELRHYERAFTAAGHRALHVWVDEVEVDASGSLRARGERFDLLYRHIFARRVEPDTVMARLLLDPGPVVLLNPVVSPLEVKGMLALIADEELERQVGISDDERAAIVRRVPWTRVCAREPGRLADGTRVPDLAAWAAGERARLVIKRSWDYGGKGVHIGLDDDDATWRERVARAAEDPNIWVLQELVPPSPHRHLLVLDGVASWRDVFVDVNAYANLGSAPPRGGVCRASASKIVNIAGGGGVAPLITRSVMDALFGATSG